MLFFFRFGLYNLETVYNDPVTLDDGGPAYPAYIRKASGQTFFFKEEYQKWIYAHKFERWLIGPKIGDENVSGRSCRVANFTNCFGQINKSFIFTVWKIHDFPITQILREINF